MKTILDKITEAKEKATGSIITTEFCEQCSVWRVFVRPKQAANDMPWRCIGRADYHRLGAVDTCGYETVKFREYTNMNGMSH